MKRSMGIIGIIAIMIAVFAVAVSADITSVKVISVSVINQDPDPAIAGGIVEVRFGVENSGGEPVGNLILEIDPDYPFELVPGTEEIQELGTIQGFQTDENMKIVKYRLRVAQDAPAGNYDLNVKYYEEGSGAEVQKTLSLDVKNQDNAEVIHIDKSVLIPGKDSSLTFTINNVGNAPLKNLQFYWENEDEIILPVGSDNTKYVKYLEIGESAMLEYSVIADTNADPGLYKLNLHLIYDDPINGGSNSISTIAGVYVGGETDFEVAFSETTSSGTSFTIANIGSNPAYSVSIVIPEQDGWRVTGSNSMIIGNLNKGDYTVASFALQQGRTTSSDPSVLIQVDYTDTRGERLSVEKEVKVNMVSATTDGAVSPKSGRMPVQEESFLSKYQWPLLALIVLIAGFVWYRMKKKSGKK